MSFIEKCSMNSQSLIHYYSGDPGGNKKEKAVTSLSEG